ncbi:MAG: helix-turn-helix domain-containing protein, partial [Bacteroidota bacterium]
GGESHFWIISYSFILVQSFVYVYLSASIVGEKAQKRSKDIRWVMALIVCLTIMWLVYALIFLRIIPLYSLGPVTFSITIFILLYIALNHHHLFTNKKRSKAIHPRMSEQEGKSHFSSLKSLLEKEQLYKQADLSLSSLGVKMNLLERDISFIINSYGKCNFSQFVNGYRIAEAKRLIEENSSEKLIVIAHEAGFNNLSTFNKAFKSVTGLTPSEYKKK